MAFNPSIIAASSLMPGLQNSGQISGSVTIAGTLYASPSYSSNTSNTTGTIYIDLPDPTVISAFRVTLPNADGELATRWFPLIGSTVLVDKVAGVTQWKLILYLVGTTTGRAIYYNFVNALNSQYDVSITLDYYAHLYTYPWK